MCRCRLGPAAADRRNECRTAGARAVPPEPVDPAPATCGQTLLAVERRSGLSRCGTDSAAARLGVRHGRQRTARVAADGTDNKTHADKVCDYEGQWSATAAGPSDPADQASRFARQPVTETDPSPSFFTRHQFLIYRLFSLAGLVPVGAFLVVHLLTNASVLSGPGTFQSRVDMIHSLGPLLVPIEWLFIFLPMMFHAAVGFVIIANGMPNVGSYSYVGNVRYTLQRATGMIAFAFILWHVTRPQSAVHDRQHLPHPSLQRTSP